MMRIFFYSGFGFLQFIDLGINRLKFLGVVRAIVFAAGHVRHFLQRILIDIDRTVLINDFAVGRISADGHRCRAALADANRIDLDL